MTKQRLPIHGGKPTAGKRAERRERSFRAERRKRDGKYTYPRSN
jgi:hypothetical protein